MEMGFAFEAFTVWDSGYIRRLITLCISYLFHCCGQIPDDKQLGEEGSILVHSSSAGEGAAWQCSWWWWELECQDQD